RARWSLPSTRRAPSSSPARRRWTTSTRGAARATSTRATPTRPPPAWSRAALEGTQDAVVSGSGMAAIATGVLAFVGAGGRIVSTSDLYGGTINLFRTLESRFGIRIDHVSPTDVDALRAALRTKADLVYLETPTNPTLRLVDLAQSAQIARAAGAVTLVDSTFASPVNSRPHALGIDL